MKSSVKEGKGSDPSSPRYSRKDLVQFTIVMLLFLLFVIWVGSAWLLVLCPIIVDAYLLKKVNWTFWKRREGKNNFVVEWIDALLFAVVVVSLINIFIFQNYKIPTGSMEKTLLIGDHLYVSKLKYGPKLPNTPLSLPFMQHTLPGTLGTKSYLEWIQWPYKRLLGFGNVKRDDIVVFNFPEGDTVILQLPNESYYGVLLQYTSMFRSESTPGSNRSAGWYEAKARDYIRQNYNLTVRPVDRRDNYVKRCVALPGDTLEVKEGRVFVNGKAQEEFAGIQFDYRVVTDGARLNPKTLENLGIYRDDMVAESSSSYIVPLTETSAAAFRQIQAVKSVERVMNTAGYYNEAIFPHHPDFSWNEDFFGPLVIPSKGATVELNPATLALYGRIISAYEGNRLEYSSNPSTPILINGKEATTYTFAMDYYFMMGDNRDHSLDSRYWGFVPEDHIVGAPRRVWLSLDKEKSFPANIRWNRFFRAAGR